VLLLTTRADFLTGGRARAGGPGIAEGDGSGGSGRGGYDD